MDLRDDMLERAFRVLRVKSGGAVGGIWMECLV